MPNSYTVITTPFTITKWYNAIIQSAALTPGDAEAANVLGAADRQTRQFVYDFLNSVFSTASQPLLLAAACDATTVLGKVSGSTANTGGTQASIVQGTISTPDFRAGAVDTTALKDGSVTTAKLASGASLAIPTNGVVTLSITDQNVTTAKIADANVTTAKIANGAVTAALIGTGAVVTAGILDANVTTSKILDANVTTAKIADANVTTAKILDANVTAAKLASGAAVANIASAGLAGSQIANGGVTATQIASDAVTTVKILDGNVTAAKLAPAAAAGYVLVSGATPFAYASVLMSGGASISSAGVVTINPTAIGGVVVLAEQATQGTAAGASSATTKQTRGLTGTTNCTWTSLGDPQSQLAAAPVNTDGKIKLVAGTYLVECSVPGNKTGLHRAYVENYASGGGSPTATLVGTTSSADAGEVNITNSLVKGYLTITTGGYLLITHYTVAAQATNGLGLPLNISSFVENYSMLKITRVA